MSPSLLQFNPSTLKASYNASTRKAQLFTYGNCGLCVTTPPSFSMELGTFTDECYCIGPWFGGESWQFQFIAASCSLADIVSGNTYILRNGSSHWFLSGDANCIWQTTIAISSCNLDNYKCGLETDDTPYSCANVSNPCVPAPSASFTISSLTIAVKRFSDKILVMLSINVSGFGNAILRRWDKSCSSGECCDDCSGSIDVDFDYLLAGGSFTIT